MVLVVLGFRLPLGLPLVLLCLEPLHAMPEQVHVKVKRGLGIACWRLEARVSSGISEVICALWS